MNALRGIHRHPLVKRTALFSASIGLSTIVGIFSIPILVSQLGASLWAILAVFQSVCAFFAVFIAWGWGATGPSIVAGLPVDERRQLYATSVVARVVLFVVAVPVAIVVGVLVTQESWLVATLAALAYLLPGLSAAWFFIGTNRPIKLFLLDSLPVILGNIVGLVVVLIVPSLEAYLASIAVFSLVGVVAANASASLSGPGAVVWRHSPRSLFDTYKSQLAGVTTTVTSSFYSSIPTVAVRLFAPQALEVFVMADRLYRYGVLVLAPILQSIQSWIPESGVAEAKRRSRQSLTIGIGIGVLGAVFLVIFAAPVSSLLTHGEVVVPLGLMVLMSIAFAGDAVAQVTGLAGLVALGGSRQLALSALFGTLAGSGLVLLGASMASVFGSEPTAGAVGVAAAISLTCVGLATYRSAVLVRLAR
ncbi:hypothetical protein MN032_09965 [Agromyces atrinae]|uniref:hypothetical protein n=1 Tax=Agromyces atrinae TaxID=592376 RepID=UPI001F58ED9D|nr:hypothetical protein [Agromyces atrinae]MCI2958019.1 hypothetical protein [Agromyces atrinae]